MHYIATINGGSSSIKCSLYASESKLTEQGTCKVDGIGTGSGRLILKSADRSVEQTLGMVDHQQSMAAIVEAVAPSLGDAEISGMGHRIVHGGPDFSDPMVLDDATISKLEKFIPFAPLHQPHNLAAVRAARQHFPDMPQVGCFDTAFHRGHPWVNDTFALPRRYYEAGVRRYGFHGLSYTYITGKLAELEQGQHGRTVVAHLGNGASMCAILDGKSIGSTMGFSALDGLPMGTRCGQLDPGVLLYMMQEEGLNGDQISDILYKQSGLLGISNMSSDMRKLQDSDAPAAREALDYYVFRIRRELGAMAAILGGVDTLVFCGGIGENSAPIRERVCEDMDWLGIELNDSANQRNDPVISDGPVKVRVIPTDEELVIARAVAKFLN